MTMKPMLFQGLRVLLVTTGSLLMVASADAQEKQKLSYKIPSGVTQITQRHVLDVGDVPGHQVTLAEYHSKYTNEAPGPVYGGVKAVESWQRYQGDIVNGTGFVSGYGVDLLENGDKIFGRAESVLHSTVAPDGVSTPQQKCIGWPEQKYIIDAGKEAPDLGAFRQTSGLGGIIRRCVRAGTA